MTFILFIGFIVFSMVYNVYGKKIIAGHFISPACLALFFVLLAFMMGKEDDPALPFVVLIFYIFMTAGQIGTDIIDYEGDKAAGYRRLPVVLGPLKAASVAVLLSGLIPIVLVAAYIHLSLSLGSLFVTALVVVLVVPVSVLFRKHAVERTIQTSGKALGTLTIQYGTAMASLVLGLGIVHG